MAFTRKDLSSASACFLFLLLSLLVILVTRNTASAEKDQLLVEDSNASDQSADDPDLLTALRSKLSESLDVKWAIEESDKAQCCLAAFALCEKVPTGAEVKRAGAKSLLNTARSKCAAIKTMTLRSKPQICAFYGNLLQNCAFTPNTEADWDMYFAGQHACCQASKTHCESSPTPTNLYKAKEACIGFGLSTEAEICAQAMAPECKAN